MMSSTNLYLAAGFLAICFRSACSTSCHRHMCHGDVGNLATGRSIHVSSWCGDDIEEEEFSTTLDGCRNTTTTNICRTGSHPPSHMNDSPFRNPHTFWQSKQLRAGERVELRFDLETSFYFTHLIIIFNSVRPGAMTLERSVDNGKSWQVYKYFARNCSEVFGLDDDEGSFRSICSSKYSQKEPCSRGEVVYRVLNPTKRIKDPYSAYLRHLLKVTNLKIQMWNPQQCGECPEEGFQHISIYDIQIRGTCFCNGHADSCVPMQTDAEGTSNVGASVVHGKCLCEHHTIGSHCERCARLYNDAPWQPANGATGEANACKKCNCNGHATSCRLDENVWRKSGMRSGGVCINCTHNTIGRSCEWCAKGYFRTLDSQVTDPDVCEACECNTVGTLRFDGNNSKLATYSDDLEPCDRVTGQCRCKIGVTGRRCDRCLPGFGRFSGEGCVECLCDRCDHVTGACLPNYDDDIFSNLPVFSEDDLLVNRFNEPFRDYDFRSEFDGDFYPPRYESSRTAAAHVSWKPGADCVCKESDINDIPKLCRKDFDYAVKARVLKTEDFGTYIHIHVAVKRIFKEGKINIEKTKIILHPESWLKMGCTCPVLIPNREYVIMGSEDVEKKKLLINMKSYVKQWTHGKHWIRHIVKLFRSKKCK